MNSSARIASVACIAILALGTFVGPAAANEAPATGQFIVELDENGDAHAVFTDEFDLTDPDQREVFENVRDAAELRDAATTQLRDDMQVVSDVASEDLDREIRVGNVFAETAIDGETGIVAYRFRWENLAVVDGDRIVLSEPFSTYDGLDRELIVLAPEGGALVSVSPEPQRRGEDVATWPGLTQFGEGFEVVATAAEAPDEADSQAPMEPPIDPDDAYGGGPLALAVSALLMGTLLVGRER